MKSFKRWLPLLATVSLLAAVVFAAGPFVAGSGKLTVTAGGMEVVLGASNFGGGEISTDGGINMMGSTAGVNLLRQNMPAATATTAQCGMLAIPLLAGYAATDCVFGVGSNTGVAGLSVFSAGMNLIGDFTTGSSSDILGGRLIRSGAGSGSNGLAILTNGARIDYGAGASDYADSDGTTVSFAGPIRSTTHALSSYSDQSADCDNAATANTQTGRLCIQNGQGSMTLTNSLIVAASTILLTNVSDDTTCLSGYVTAGVGSAVVGCVGAATATANTVMNFLVVNQ